MSFLVSFVDIFSIETNRTFEYYRDMLTVVLCENINVFIKNSNKRKNTDGLYFTGFVTPINIILEVEVLKCEFYCLHYIMSHFTITNGMLSYMSPQLSNLKMNDFCHC